MNRIFGKASNTTPKTKPTLNDTAAMLDSRVETLNKKIADIDRQIGAWKALPAASRTTPAGKQRGMKLLQQRKMYEGQRNQVEGQSANIGQTAFAIGNIEVNKQMISGMKDAHKQLTKGYKEMNINKVEKLRDDVEDVMFDYSEINEALSRPMNEEFVSDADLEAELAAIGAEDMGIDSGAMFNDLHAPSVPVQPVSVGAQATNKDGILVDEFGLPKLPAAGMRH